MPAQKPTPREPSVYIVWARNTYHGDHAMFGVLDFTVEAHTPRQAERIARERYPDLPEKEPLAVVNARYFYEFYPDPGRSAVGWAPVGER